MDTEGPLIAVLREAPPCALPLKTQVVIAAPHLSDEMDLWIGVYYFSDWMIELQLPGQINNLPYAVVRVLPPSPHRHAAHMAPLAV